MTPVSPSTAERLGYASTDRVAIVTACDLGLCHAVNDGVFDVLGSRRATSASLMVPGPWAREAAARYRGEDIGVQLTLNAEFDLYRWGPTTHSPSLLDGDGGFPRTLLDVWDHADLDEVRRECRAQIERAIYWGFDVSHIATHRLALLLRPEFFDVYVEVAVEFGLPMRLGSPAAQKSAGFPFIELARSEGVVSADNFVDFHPAGDPEVEELISNLAPGVTEVMVHPAVDTPELRALDPEWATRVAHHDLLTGDHDLRTHLSAAGADTIGYLALRELQRSGG